MSGLVLGLEAEIFGFGVISCGVVNMTGVLVLVHERPIIFVLVVVLVLENNTTDGRRRIRDLTCKELTCCWSSQYLQCVFVMLLVVFLCRSINQCRICRRQRRKPAPPLINIVFINTFPPAPLY